MSWAVKRLLTTAACGLAGGVRGHTTRAPTKADYNNSNDNAHCNNIPFELIKTHSTTITHHFGTNRQLEPN